MKKGANPNWKDDVSFHYVLPALKDSAYSNRDESLVVSLMSPRKNVLLNNSQCSMDGRL